MVDEGLEYCDRDELSRIIREMSALAEKQDIKPNYMVMIFDGYKFMQGVFYETRPTKTSLEHLREELKEDEEFGLQDVADTLEFVAIDQSVKRI